MQPRLPALAAIALLFAVVSARADDPPASELRSLPDLAPLAPLTELAPLDAPSSLSPSPSPSPSPSHASALTPALLHIPSAPSAVLGQYDEYTRPIAAFAIDAAPVTASSYSRCVTAGGCTSPACSASPSSSSSHAFRVTCVDFAQASAYCAFVGGRLPTEEEWEHAARESRMTGMRDTDDAAEWTSSPYCYFCGRNDEVVRGGPAHNPGLRGWRAPDAREHDVGFRCAHDEAEAQVTR